MSLSDSLRQLPLIDPPPGGWAALQHRLDRRPRRSIVPTLLAAAASAVLASAATLQMVRMGYVPSLRPAPATTLAANLPTPVAKTPIAAVDPALAQLMQRSQQLESVLDTLRPETDVWDARLQTRTERLERGLSYVDLQLNYAASQQQPEQVRRLWANRVELMTELVATHRDARLPAGKKPITGNAI